MEHPFVIKFPVEKQRLEQAPASEMSEIRELFQQINQRYMVYEPSSYYYTIKRVIDLSISMIFIIFVMSWVFPLVAILIKLTSKGPVFFTQKRTGYKGLDFECFKFRTMYVNDEAHTKQASANDDRITPIGRFLRMTHIDETPQFFNVLLGDMSIVGPRPHMLYHTNHYAKKTPYYNLRHEAQPGMTGMAQIKGYIGEINAERELRKRVQWDIYYLRHRSIALDIKIIMTTIGHVFMKAFSFIPSKKNV